MTEKPMTHFEFSSKGGRSRSAAKVTAVRNNLAKARQIKLEQLKAKKP
jgi:hypothetical protein